MLTLSRRAALASSLGGVLAGCTSPRLATTPIDGDVAAYGVSAFEPLDLSARNLMKITVCTRPLREAGPRLEATEQNGRPLVHNYGHGGSGWSLAWGYAEEARRLLARARPGSVAVLGAGAIGLATATALAETGARVTVYARQFPMETRSARATGVWSPSSRIGLASAAAPGFGDLWERLARKSYARHLSYVGRSGAPVEFTPRFYVRTGAPEPALAEPPSSGNDFLELDRRLRGLTPPWAEREGTPFPSENGVRSGLVMTFNIAEYTRQLVEDLGAMGAKFERAEIGSPRDATALPGDALVNCSGYGAKALFGDETLVPVRGQIAWLAPQIDRLYGVIHRNVTALSRRDGLLIQEMGGSDYYGFGDESEEPSHDEFEAALAKIAPVLNFR